MKKKILIFVIVFLLIIVGLTGCEELEKLDKPDYITIIVACSVHVEIYTGSDVIPADYIQVRIEIIKAGGERVSEIVSTNVNGYTNSVKGTFKLYKEQPITVIANVILSSVQKYSNYTFNSDSYTAPWNFFYPAYDFGETGDWNFQLKINGVRKG